MIEKVYNFFLYLSCSLLWMGFNEKFSWGGLVVGFLLGIMAVYFTEHHLSTSCYNCTYRISPWVMTKYAFFLFYQIFYSGLLAAKIIITGKIDLGVVHITTELKDDFRRSILANSITLTPGTVTIECANGELTVLWIKCDSTECKEAGEMIKGSMERRLLEG